MKIGVIGAGNIGSNAGRLFAQAGHDVLLSYTRDPATLRHAPQRSARRPVHPPTRLPSARW
jgi:predicted dinucleotide-binding enzyme